jgi:hypothetical protein
MRVVIISEHRVYATERQLKRKRSIGLVSESSNVLSSYVVIYVCTFILV